MRLLAFLLFCLAVSSSAQEIVRLDEELETIRAANGVPALAAVAIVDGERRAFGAVGTRRAGEDDPVTIADKFHLGSDTKSMTATVAAALVEDGLISWESTIGEVLERYDMDEGYRSVTLAQLLSNRGGFPGDVPPDIWAEAWDGTDKPERSRKQFVESMLEVPPAYPPGQGEQYSNAGFTVAGHLLEVVTRKSWEELMEERLFQPLGMESAGFGGQARDSRNPQPWGHKGDGTPVPPGPGDDNPSAIGPAGTVHCSLPDLALYVKMHLLRETGTVLKEAESYDVLHTALDPDHGYAKGWLVTERSWGGTVLTHNGSNTMNYCTIWFSPEKKFAGIAASNAGNADKACDEAVAMMIGKFLE